MSSKTGAARTNGPGRGDLSGFRDPINENPPKAGEDLETSPAPVADDPGPGEAREDDAAPQADDTNKKPGEGDEPERPSVPPSDETRNAIAKRFTKHRGEPPPRDDGDEGDDTADTPEAPEKPGPSDSEELEDTSKKLTLVVHDKSRQMTVEEVAALSELSVEDVIENPARAIKYAQRELATRDNLARSRDIRRDQPARQDDPANRRPPNQERTEPGDDDAPTKPDPSRETNGDVDFAQLVEDIQLEDPKAAGEKLRQAFDTVADRKVSEGETRRLFNADRTASARAVKEFMGDAKFKAIAKNAIVKSAIGSALFDEYREDLVTAMVADGEDPATARQIADESDDEDVAKAHQRRRIVGDPNVRPVTKKLFETAYQRAAKSFGVTPGQQQQDNPTQDGKPAPASRAQRVAGDKANLQPQPRRASVSPSTAAPAKGPIKRSDAVAQMRASRGQAGPAAVR